MLADTVAWWHVAQLINATDLLACAFAKRSLYQQSVTVTDKGRKLLASHVVIYESVESARAILPRIYVPAVQSLILAGFTDDLVGVLNYVAGLATSESWNVEDFTLCEGKSSEGEPDDVSNVSMNTSLEADWCGALQLLLERIAATRTRRMRLFLATELDRERINNMTTSVLNSNHLQHLELGGRSRVLAERLVEQRWMQRPRLSDRIQLEAPRSGHQTSSAAPSLVMSPDLTGLPVSRIEDPRAASPDRRRIDRGTGLVVAPSMIVISHTVGNKEGAVGQFKQNGVMQHFLITSTGGVLQLVDTSARAWHAGVAFWGRLSPGGRGVLQGGNDVNSHSIGITLEGNGCEDDFKVEQYVSLRLLLKRLCTAFGIRGIDVVGLAEVAHPPGRHRAPGRHFDWDKLRDCTDDTFLSRARVADLMRQPGAMDSTTLPAACLQTWGYSLGTTPEHLKARMRIMADRFLGPLAERGDRDFNSCALALGAWRAQLEG